MLTTPKVHILIYYILRIHHVPIGCLVWSMRSLRLEQDVTSVSVVAVVAGDQMSSICVL
jgi:hypothetical protein